VVGHCSIKTDVKNKYLIQDNTYNHDGRVPSPNNHCAVENDGSKDLNKIEDPQDKHVFNVYLKIGLIIEPSVISE
jgi:hypothetical protein